MTPESFQPMSSSVLPSQAFEVTIAKQASLSAHGQQTRAALSKRPPSVVDTLLADYKAPSDETLNSVFIAMAEREHVIESAEKGQNLDVEWLRNGGGVTQSKMNEVGLGADDPWNGPSV